MDETEFERNMESAQSLLSGLSESSDSHSQADQTFNRVASTESMESRPTSSSKRHQGSTTHQHASVESTETKSKNDEQYGKDSSSLNKIPSISDLENRGANALLKENEVSPVFRDFPYLYAQAGDLTIGEVEDLLNNYKQLVFKYVCLAKGLGVPIPSPTLSNAQGQNSEPPEVSSGSENIPDVRPKESESDKVTETHPNESSISELPSAGDDLGEASVSMLEGSQDTESKMVDDNH